MKSEICKTIKELRKQRWKTQKEVAAAVGLTQAGYAHIESGKNQPKIKYIQKLAKYYGLTTDDIMNCKNLVS